MHLFSPNIRTQHHSKLENPPMVPVVLVILVLLILIALIAFGFIAVIKRTNESQMGRQSATKTTSSANATTTPATNIPVDRQDIQLADQINQKPLPGKFVQ